MFNLLGCVKLLSVLCPAAIEHILHAKAQTPSPLLLLLIMSGKRLCSRSCQNDTGDIRRWVFEPRYIWPKIIWSKEKSRFQISCIDRGIYSTLSRQGFYFTGIMRNTVWLIFISMHFLNLQKLTFQCIYKLPYIHFLFIFILNLLKKKGNMSF